jgi:hypothetical protein
MARPDRWSDLEEAIRALRLNQLVEHRKRRDALFHRLRQPVIFSEAIGRTTRRWLKPGRPKLTLTIIPIAA